MASAPAQDQRISMENSIRLQRNMMRMVFGEVAYQRGLFPEDCFVLADVRAHTSQRACARAVGTRAVSPQRTCARARWWDPA